MLQKTVRLRSAVLGEGMPKICIPVCAANQAELPEIAERIIPAQPDLVEFRADYLKTALAADKQETSFDGAAAFEALFSDVAEMLSMLRAMIPEVIPVLFTFRTKKEGGCCELPASVYLRLNRMVAEKKLADAVDLELFTDCAEEELRAFIQEAHKSDVGVIVSSHDFQKTPATEELLSRLERMQALGGDIAKIAVMPESIDDTFRLMAATLRFSSKKETSVPVITMAMGQLGLLSRICGEVYGSVLTFGTAGTASAPGQIDAKILRSMLRELHEKRSNAVSAAAPHPAKIAEALQEAQLFSFLQSMIESTQQKKQIYLIGFMGAGKSSVATALSKHLGLLQIEMDEEISREAGMPIRDIFAVHGEQHFRELETELIRRIAGEEKKAGVIVSCGGGAVLRGENVDLMKKNGQIILLTAKPETIYARVKDSTQRPLLNGRMNIESIAALMEERRPLYESVADLTVETDEKNLEELCEEICIRTGWDVRQSETSGNSDRQSPQ